MAGAPCFSRVIFPSFGSQPPSYAPLSPLRPRRDGLPFSVPGFAPRQQARHVRRPYRIHSRCRPTVHLQLLSTPPHGDAVSFGYGPEGTGPGGLAPPGDAPLQAHCPGLQSGGRLASRENRRAMRTRGGRWRVGPTPSFPRKRLREPARSRARSGSTRGTTPRRVNRRDTGQANSEYGHQSTRGKLPPLRNFGWRSKRTVHRRRSSIIWQNRLPFGIDRRSLNASLMWPLVMKRSDAAEVAGERSVVVCAVDKPAGDSDEKSDPSNPSPAASGNRCLQLRRAHNGLSRSKLRRHLGGELRQRPGDDQRRQHRSPLERLRHHRL